MDLVKSWGLSAIVGFASYLALGFVLGGLASFETLSSPWGEFLLLRAPAFAIPALMAFAAAAVHSRPQRRRLDRHLVAVSMVPLGALGINAVAGVGQRGPFTMLVAMLVGLAGIASGWLLASLARREAPWRSAPRHPY